MNAERHQYIVCYDVRDPKRLRQTYKTMLGYGDPLQYSVFVCELSEVERLLMEADLRDVVTIGEDSVAIIDLGRASSRARRRVRLLGKGPFRQRDIATVV